MKNYICWTMLTTAAKYSILTHTHTITTICLPCSFKHFLHYFCDCITKFWVCENYIFFLPKETLETINPSLLHSFPLLLSGFLLLSVYCSFSNITLIWSVCFPAWFMLLCSATPTPDSGSLWAGVGYLGLWSWSSCYSWRVFLPILCHVSVFLLFSCK